MSSDAKTVTTPVLGLITGILQLLSRDPSKADIRKRKAELRLAKKELRVAKRMVKQLEKEYNEDGVLTPEEAESLKDLKQRLRQRKADLV